MVKYIPFLRMLKFLITYSLFYGGERNVTIFSEINIFNLTSSLKYGCLVRPFLYAHNSQNLVLSYYSIIYKIVFQLAWVEFT